MIGAQVAIIASDALAGFNYGALGETEAAEARAAASRIQRRNRKMVEGILENGRDLLLMKARLPHGHFEAWAESECGIAPRTARNYMAVARDFGDKSALVADLPPSTIYALTSAPSVRAQVIETRQAGGKVDEETIADLLWQDRQEQKKAKATAKFTPEQRKRLKAREERDRRDREQANQERALDAKRREAATAEAAALIVEKMPDDVPRLLALLDVTWNAGELVRAIKASTRPA